LRRQDITLRRAARLGDGPAKMELAKRYLQGDQGFPRHVALGLEYLGDPVGDVEALTLIATSLTLQELCEFGRIGVLEQAAGHDRALAAKLAIWQIATGSPEKGLEGLTLAMGDRSLPIRQAWARPDGAGKLEAALRAAAPVLRINAGAVAMAAAKILLERQQIEEASLALCATLALDGASETTNRMIAKLLWITEHTSTRLRHLRAEDVQLALEQQCVEADSWAWFTLGRALCGIPCGLNAPTSLVRRENLRRGSALLMRAGDAGVTEAWQHLYSVNSNPRCSVANPELARFCLEKAALHGHAESQRRLGALLMRDATNLPASEEAISWLARAMEQGDLHARKLLRSLVLPVQGTAGEASAAIAQVEAQAPWLAARLKIARHYGLTKLEALTFDPVAGARSWGIVTGAQSFSSQSRLSAPRAVPALVPRALEDLRRAVSLFSSMDAKGILEGNLRRRSTVLRRVLLQLGVEEQMFFADADSHSRDRLRVGTRWAHFMREPLNDALSCVERGVEPAPEERASLGPSPVESSRQPDSPGPLLVGMPAR
jgi:TPR repeat protein